MSTIKFNSLFRKVAMLLVFQFICYAGFSQITLNGRVLPIGGLKEKSIAAHRSGLKTIMIPFDNKKDLEDIPKEIQEALEIVPVASIEEIITRVLK